ncbi:MAG: isopentenyl-diphosphate delta-isomerase [Bacteroidia bacterium]
MQSDTTSSRKADHIDLAFLSQVSETDKRFYYEPVLQSHPDNSIKPINFLDTELGAPIWVSSMTGGTTHAKTINQNLAKACGKYKMGMGLGSCRIILDNDTFLEDFKVRKNIGDQMPLYANLGIAQVEELLVSGHFNKIKELIDKTEANGLIVHINPLQEWLQPEGDRINQSPLLTLRQLLDKSDLKIIIKEVGQGMGPESLKSLMELPLTAIDFGAHGGTNFAMLEMLRGNEIRKEVYEPVANIGHTAVEMVGMVNGILSESKKYACQNFIISGGIKSFLDGYYLTEKINANAIYGQASALLKHAKEDYEMLCEYLELQIKGLAMAKSFLKIR